jgi:hypothetical protein
VRPYLENTHHKKRKGEVAQGVGPEFKLQYQKKKKTLLCIFIYWFLGEKFKFRVCYYMDFSKMFF